MRADLDQLIGLGGRFTRDGHPAVSSWKIKLQAAPRAETRLPDTGCGIAQLPLALLAAQHEELFGRCEPFTQQTPHLPPISDDGQESQHAGGDTKLAYHRDLTGAQRGLTNP